MLQEFKPKKEIEAFCEKSLINLIMDGEFRKASKLCNKHGVSLTNYRSYFPTGTRKAILSHRVGPLLSFVYNNPDLLVVDKIELLKIMLSHGDYHGFLKNCHRFNVVAEFRDEIEQAITKVRYEEGLTWRKKFNM